MTNFLRAFYKFLSRSELDISDVWLAQTSLAFQILESEIRFETAMPFQNWNFDEYARGIKALFRALNM